MRRLPPLRYFLYVFGTVNVVMAVVLVLAALVSSGGVNIVTIAFVTLVVNAACAISVARNA
jgi:hypothetical protein